MLIVNKVIITLLIFIFILIGYSTFGHIFTQNIKNTINDIEINKFPTLLIKIENLKLINDMINILADIAVTSELDMLQKAQDKRDKVLENISEITSYVSCGDVELKIRLLNDYYTLSEKFVIELANNPDNLDYTTMQKIQNIKNEMLKKFTDCKDKTYNKFKLELKNISSNTENFFYKSQIFSIIAILLMITFSILIARVIDKRFKIIIDAISNLITDKPDFSKRLNIESKDEIGLLAQKFNLLSSRFEENYENLQLLKIKADENAKSKDEFLSNMSHEIRTPLNGIIGMSHILLEKNTDKTNEEYIKKVNKSAKMLLRIINDILDLAKLDAKKIVLDKVEFDIVELLNNVKDVLIIVAQDKNIKINLLINIDINYKYYGDDIRITQILINLVGNAIKFTDNGDIDIIVSNLDNNKIRFEVKDNGIGISEEMQNKIFEVFSQADGSTSRKYGGTGLGLTLCKEFVELMNGTIFVQSKLGVGSNFIFDIELVKSKNIIMNQKILDSQKIESDDFGKSFKKFVISEENREFFDKLKNVSNTKKPKDCQEVIAQKDKYILTNDEEILFDNFKNLIKKYKFKEAGELI
jgi:signal transduction histidine kinase